MSKKLNIIEAMKMPIGTEFKVIFNGEKMPNNTMVIYGSLVGDRNTKYIDWKSHPKDTFMKPFDFLINGVFIPIQKPVSFMEVVNSDKRCRVEHELFARESYWYLREILAHISDHFNSEIIRKIILEGKWYIEESEANSNE